MNKYKTLAALVATALLATAGAASAQTAVTGGGASLPADLYKGAADSILPANFSYAVTGSGTGKKPSWKTMRRCSPPPAPCTSPAAIRC